MNVLNIDIDSIDVGERRREDLGDIDGLSASIHTIGLLHPIIVDKHDGHYRLVAGRRRLSAVVKLGWNQIPAQLLHTLSDDELREIEWEENERRKALTDGERGRTFRKAKELKQDAAIAETKSAQSAQIKTKAKKGKRKLSLAKRADLLGISESSLRQAEQQVDIAEKFPFMQGMEWVEGHVRQARRILKDVPDDEYGEINNYVASHLYIHPTTVIEILDKLAHRHNKEKRQRIYQLIRSDDTRDQDLAKSLAMERVPLPNPVIQHLKEAAKSLRLIVKNYPHDDEIPAVKQIIKQLEDLAKNCIRSTAA